MRKQLPALLFIAALLPFQLLYTQSPSSNSPLPLLSPTDTIFLHIDQNGMWFPHTIQAGQTLYSIANFYGLSLHELYTYNPGFQNRSYQVGEQLHIPIPKRAIIRYKGPNFTASEYLPVCYVVRKGDTLFGIAKRKFQMPIETIMKRNALQTYHIEVGQPLQIGWMKLHGIPDSLRRIHGGPLWQKSYELEKKFDTFALKQPVHFEQGPARWIKPSPGASYSGLYALHNKAAKGSIIAINNPMTGREVFVKILGKIPPSYQPETLVVVSSDVARMLGVLDEKFFAQIRYF